MNTNGYKRWLVSTESQAEMLTILRNTTDPLLIKSKLTNYLLDNLPPPSYPAKKRDGFKPAEDLIVPEVPSLDL